MNAPFVNVWFTISISQKRDNQYGKPKIQKGILRELLSKPAVNLIKAIKYQK